MSLFDSKRGLKCFYPWDQMLHLSKLVAFMDRHKSHLQLLSVQQLSKVFPWNERDGDVERARGPAPGVDSGPSTW